MSSPTKSCTLDLITTDLLKESVDVLLPYLTAMVNGVALRGQITNVSEGSHHHAAAEEAVAGRQRAQELPAGVQPLVSFKGHRESCC